MIRELGAAAGLLVLLTANAEPDPAAAFGARESIQNISLSPDGRHIAYVAPSEGQGSRVYTVNLATGASLQTTAVDGRTQRLGRCGWVAAERLVCSIFALRRVQNEVGGATAFAALDIDGSDVVALGVRDYRTGHGAGFDEVVDWLAGEDGEILMSGHFYSGGSRSNRGLGVVRIDTRSNAVDAVELPVMNGAEYISDGRGRVRIHGTMRIRGATGMAAEEIEYRYRASGSNEWRPFGVYNFMSRDGMNPLAVDAALDAAYVLDKLNGRTALYRVALDGSARRELLVSHEEVDVDGLLTLGRRGRVIGATYATETRQTVYFDPELRALAERLSRAIPNLPLIRFAGASDDESILLIWAGSDRDPGRYYSYEKGNRRLNEIMLARPQLEGMALAEMRPIRFATADGTMVPGYLTLPPGSSGRGLPAIVMPHGGPSARDEWGFDWLAQYYANRGYAVLQPNFRGSAGFGDQWFHRNGFQSWRIAIGDVNDAGRWLVRQGIADPAKLAIVGWSYGGYAALQSGVAEPDLYRAIVAIAPVTDLNFLKEEARRWSNFRLLSDFIGSGAHVGEGSPARNAAAIRAPVLIFHGDHDQRVAIQHGRMMADRLEDAGRRVELVTFPGLDHGLEDSAARTDMLRRSDAFLRGALGIGTEARPPAQPE